MIPAVPEDEDYVIDELVLDELVVTPTVGADGRAMDRPFGRGNIRINEGDLLDPKALLTVEPEQQFEGYTGNDGMTLTRWYRLAGVLLLARGRQ